MKHALVIGGSGMLAKVSSWLADHYEKVSVVGRNQHKLNQLVRRSKKIVPISVDYYDQDQFRREIRHAIESDGSFEVVVAWIHSQEKLIIDIVSDEIQSVSNYPWSLYHVLSSSSNLEEILVELDVSDICDYHQIQLGFVIENNRSRWLTHEEISDGVIYAIQSRAKKHLVGTLTPWSQRP